MKFSPLLLLTLYSLQSFTLENLDRNVIKKDSHHSFENTLERLRSVIKSKNLSLVSEIDHAKAAQSVNLALPKTTLLLFGNPKIGTHLMVTDKFSALDLPLKILVLETKGKTQVVFRNPNSLLDDYDLATQKNNLAKMKRGLEEIIDSAIQ